MPGMSFGSVSSSAFRTVSHYVHHGVARRSAFTWDSEVEGLFRYTFPRLATSSLLASTFCLAIMMPAGCACTS